MKDKFTYLTRISMYRHYTGQIKSIFFWFIKRYFSRISGRYHTKSLKKEKLISQQFFPLSQENVTPRYSLGASRRPPTAAAWARSQVKLCAIFGEQSGLGRLFSVYLGFPANSHPTNRSTFLIHPIIDVT
jgi:hypothetical protein